jgi:hypothetical protein
MYYLLHKIIHFYFLDNETNTRILTRQISYKIAKLKLFLFKKTVERFDLCVKTCLSSAPRPQSK